VSSSSGSISLIRLAAGKCGYVMYITMIASGCISVSVLRTVERGRRGGRNGICRVDICSVRLKFCALESK